MAESTGFKTSAIAVTASGQTGGTCQTSGPYKSGGSNSVTVFLKKGQRFPAGVDGRATTWTMTLEA